MLYEYSGQSNLELGHSDDPGPIDPCGKQVPKAHVLGPMALNRKQRRAEAAITRSKRKGVKP